MVTSYTECWRPIGITKVQQSLQFSENFSASKAFFFDTAYFPGEREE